MAHLLPPAWRRGLVLGVVCASLAVVASSDALHDALLQLLKTTGAFMSAHPVLGISVFVLVSALSAMLAFFSTAIVVPAAVVTWGEALSMTLLWLGWMAGGALAYGIGVWLGRRERGVPQPLRPDPDPGSDGLGLPRRPHRRP